MIVAIDSINIPKFKIDNSTNNNKLNMRVVRILNGEKLKIKVDRFLNLTDGYYNYLAYVKLQAKEIDVIVEDFNTGRKSYKENRSSDCVYKPKVNCSVNTTNINELSGKLSNKLIKSKNDEVRDKSLILVNNTVKEKNKGKGKRSSVNKALLQMYNKKHGICYICGRKCIHPSSSNTQSNLYPTVDHIIPKCKGGIDKESNKELCCLICNNLKGQFSYSNELKIVIRRELESRGLL